MIRSIKHEVVMLQENRYSKKFVKKQEKNLALLGRKAKLIFAVE